MRRVGQIALVFAMAAMASVTVAAQEATPIGQKRASAPAATSGEAETEAGAGTACDNSVSRSTSGGGLIKRYKLAYLYALTEYVIGTCEAIDQGAWTITHEGKCKPPSGGPAVNCGTVTTGVLKKLPLGNGDCPGHTYNFASICYTWDEHIDWKIKAKTNATWNSADFTMPMVFPVNVKIKYPTSETTEGKGFGGDAGIGLWKQTLHLASDPTFDWSGNSVQETDPGPDNPANDTCWCLGSSFGQFYKITGGVWYAPTDIGGDFGPNKNGNWGYDHVGWCETHGAFFCSNPAFPTPVDYYRLKQRAPCGTTFPQQMQFQATNAGDTSWKNYGAVNTLGGSFTDVDVTSQRAGMSQTAPFNPVPIVPRLACKVPFAKAQAAAATFGASIVVSDPRPVVAAIEEIEKLSGKPITYEDPPYLNKDYMMPMVEDGNGDPRLLVPRGGSLRVTLPADASPEQKIAAAQRMVGTHNASHGAATFSVSQDGLTHVVPRQTRDVSDQLIPVTPVLDTKITVAAKPRSAMDLLGEICQAVSRVSGQPVGIGTVPTNALYQQKIEIGANNEPARQVLEKLIVANRLSLSWRLLYDPGLKTYYMNIPVVRWSSNPP